MFSAEEGEIGEECNWKRKEDLNGLLVSLARERLRPAILLALLVLRVLLVGETVDVVLLVKEERRANGEAMVASC